MAEAVGFYPDQYKNFDRISGAARCLNMVYVDLDDEGCRSSPSGSK